MIEGVIFNSRKQSDPEALRAAYRGIFVTPAGRMVLNDLCSSFRLVQRPEQLGPNAADIRAFHDGERNVVLHIIRKLTVTEENYE